MNISSFPSMMRRASFAAALCSVTVLMVVSSANAQPPGGGRGPRAPKTWDDLVEAGGNYLKSKQAEDGTWSKSTHAGITGVVLTGLLRSGELKATDPEAVKALAYIESLADPDDGNLAAGNDIFHKNYVTCVNLLALKAANDPKYDQLVQRAAEFLKTLQYDEGEEKTVADAEYGGFGYRAGLRPDLSNTHFALDALKTAGVDANDPVFKKAEVFVSRTQNLASEHNQLPWADKLNDGSFIYVLASRRGESPADAGNPRPGYGSMTYSGLKSLIHCHVPETDPRQVKAREWLARHYDVDAHAGRQSGDGSQGYYYYLLAMAKCLNLLGEDKFVDANGVEHDWRADIQRALTNRQRPDGSWGNDTGNWLESNPELDTAYALIILSYIKPKQ